MVVSTRRIIGLTSASVVPVILSMVRLSSPVPSSSRTTSSTKLSLASSSTRRHFSLDPAVQQQTDFINHHQLAGIGNGNPQGAIVFFQRHKVVAEHQVHRD